MCQKIQNKEMKGSGMAKSEPGSYNQIEMLWGDLKWAVHARNPSNITQLKNSGKLSASRCERLIDGHRKCLMEVNSAKGANILAIRV